MNKRYLSYIHFFSPFCFHMVSMQFWFIQDVELLVDSLTNLCIRKDITTG